MSLEVLPVGVKCNLACTYCYENNMRDAGNFAPGYDLAAMKAGIEAAGGDFTVFGGEPLLMPFADLADLLEWGFTRSGHTGIQTNGSLITDEHVALFQRCKTYVGISIDGPDELNDVRRSSDTRRDTANTLAAIDKLIAVGIVPSLIVTLHKGNATAERLPRLLQWLHGLSLKGIKDARIHALEVDHPEVQREWALTVEENVNAMIACCELQNRTTLRFDLFKDMASLLMGVNQASCIWGACDPLTTPAVRGISATGGSTNCSRTNKDGVDWVKADRWGGERTIVLHETPFEDGGCKDCRFFFACKGQCPGTSLNGDWRNRSDQCQVWYALLEYIEQQLVAAGQTPISMSPERRAAAVAALLNAARSGRGANRDHGDHWDAPDGYNHSDGVMTVHGDSGTTVSHGDSNAR